MSIGISHRVGTPGPFRFYTGSEIVSNALVPWPCPVAIGSHAYIIDTEKYTRSTVDILRQAYDQTGDVGEQSLSIEGYWKRYQTDWRDGAGQQYYDLAASSRSRFYTSKGIDIWDEPFQIKLLPATNNKRASAQTNLYLAVIDNGGTSYLYASDGTGIYRTANAAPLSPAFTTVTGTPANETTSLTHDGGRIWSAHGPSGVYQIDGTTATQLCTAATNLVTYANGFLFGTNGADAFVINADGSTTALASGMTLNVDTFEYTTIAGSPNAVFFGGNAGDHGQMFACTYDETTGGIGPLIPAGRLPDGEKIHTMIGYAGIMVLGTSRGFRLASVSNTTGLALGPLVNIDGAVRAFEAQGDEVWFGWENYDDLSTGLGRMKLSRFTEPLVPAYASDLMADGQGQVVSIVTFNDQRLFGVAGLGIIGERQTLVTSGTIDSGWISYSTPETKVAASVDLRHEPLDGTVTVTLIEEDGTETAIGVSRVQGSSAPSSPFGARSISAENLRLKLTLTQSETDSAAGPVLRRWLMRSIVAPAQSEQFIVPVILYERINTDIADGSYIVYDTKAEFEYLKGLEASRQPVVYKEGNSQYLVTVRNVGIEQGGVRGWNSDRTWFNATVSVRLVTLTTGGTT